MAGCYRTVIVSRTAGCERMGAATAYGWSSAWADLTDRYAMGFPSERRDLCKAGIHDEICGCRARSKTDHLPVLTRGCVLPGSVIRRKRNARSSTALSQTGRTGCRYRQKKTKKRENERQFGSATAFERTLLLLLQKSAHAIRGRNDERSDKRECD